MGIFSLLFSRRGKIPTAVFLGGNNKHDVPVVGESHYQSELEWIAGGRTGDCVYHNCFAILIPDDANLYDDNAIRIEIDGKMVGYLPATGAPKFRAALKDLNLAGQATFCRAKIVGGWDRGGDDYGHFGVLLNLAWPLKRRKTPTR
ncbi:MAG TPA: hypothetical protein ENH27_05555 [Rhizobiales bacterium]|nr:hypothetical protein [Hyphomicrobiales bacterium]